MSKNDIFKCGDAMVEALGDRSCDSLEAMEPKSAEEEGKEKHVPVIEETEKGVKVKIGSVPHPMEDEHHIEWIEVITNNWVIRRHLKAGENPEAEFWVKKDDIKLAREHCNVHGLWKK
jgi:superoxide reductase